MKSLTKARRALSLPMLLLFIGLAATLTFAVAGRFGARMRFTRELEFGSQAENLASSGLSEMVARVRHDNNYGTTASTYTVERIVPHTYDAKAGYSLTFDPARPGHSVNNIKGDAPVVTDDGTCPPGAMLVICTGHCNGYTRTSRALIAVPPYPYAISSSGPIRSKDGLTLGSVPSGYEPTKGLDLSKLTAAEMMTKGQDDANGAALVIKGKSTIVGKARSAGSADVDLTQVEVRGEIVPNAKTDDVPVLDLSALDFTSDPSTQTISENTFSDAKTMSGLLQWTGADLKFEKGLDLNGATVRVRGNLVINGPLTGNGALLVDGNVTVTGGAALSSDNKVAILSAGSVSITGTGRDSSFVQGIVYAAGKDGIKLKDTSVVGTVLNAGEDAPMQVDRATVALDPKAAKFEVEQGFTGYAEEGFKVMDNSMTNTLGFLRLKSVIIDGTPKTPTPGYFASIGQTGLTQADFEFFGTDGQLDPSLLTKGYNDNKTPIAQLGKQVMKASSPSYRGAFQFDLNKFLKSSEQLRVVWIRD